jgi:antitoxin MazE
VDGEYKMMQARIQKWGNSLAIRIPKPFALEIGLEQNSIVAISVKEGKLLLEPIKPSYSLKELLAEVTTDNLHHEFETGPAVGNESW